MPAPTTYIPPREADFVNWVTNFNTLIQAGPAAYGISNPEAANLATLTSTYLAAYSLGTSPTTRTTSTIAAKDVARVNVTSFARQLAQIIQNTPGITMDQLNNLGLTLRKTQPTPIPAPTTSPLLSFIASTPGQQTLRASDQNTPDKRGKPFGSLQLRLQVWVTGQGVSPAGNPDQVLTLTKQPIAVNFGGGTAGKAANYIGQWQTRTGLLGPNSAPLVATIA
jgi:hypothetical protein